MKAARVITSAVVLTIGIALGFLSKPAGPTLNSPETESAPKASTSSSSSASDRVSTAFARLLHQSDFQQLAEAGSIVRDLDNREMGALLDRLERQISGDADNLLKRLLSDWTRRDPEAASAWMRPRLDGFSVDPFQFS